MILVTGATGLLGSHVVCELVSAGRSVRAMYRSDIRRNRVLKLLEYYFPDSFRELWQKIEWIECDILDLMDLETAFDGCDEVVHCAALVSFHRRDFYDLFQANRTGTSNVVNQALLSGIRKLVHVSSTAAIGSDSELHDGIKRESNRWNPNESASGYALSKYSAEKEVWRGIEEGLNAAIVNPSLMFGPGDWDESSLTILRTLKNGLRFYTKGGNAFVDVRDVAKAIRLLLDSDVSAERYLVTGHNLSFREFFNAACAQMSCKAPSVSANRLMTSIAWRASRTVSRFTGKRPTITKESAASSQTTTLYSSDKLLTQFPDFRFHSVGEMLENAVKGRL
jgi:dihydroflavonol-4-reductase